MGTWGASNIESDGALDYLATQVVGPLVSTMQSVLTDLSSAEPDEPTSGEIMMAVEILCLLCEQFGAVPPTLETVSACRRAYLRVWDGYIDQLQPKEDYKRERRAVIVSSFDRLVDLARSWHDRTA